MNKGKISIIMGVYNSEDTISKAIDSILKQTYKNWEFIICDDASIDNSYEIIKSYKNKFPKKFKILRNQRNSKLAFSLNRCLEAADGEYIARMDADDISKRNRLEKQIKFLERHRNIDLVGSAMQRFNDDGLKDIIYPPQDPDRYSLRNKIPFNHATIMTYKCMYRAIGNYTVAERTQRSQDYDLWFKFYYKNFKGSNILEPLYYVREDEKAIKRRTFKVRLNAYKTTLMGYKLLNYPLHWYIKPTISLMVKSIVPSSIVIQYRKYQAYKFNKRKEL